MTTYFGLCDSAGNPTKTGSDDGYLYTDWNIDGTLTFVCPGVGPQIIRELSCLCHLDSGTVHIRLAVYSADRTTLISQGTSVVTVTGTSDTWQGHDTAGLSVKTLTGGTNYTLVVSADDVGGSMGTTHSWASIGIGGRYDSIDRATGGYSGALPTGTDGFVWPIRCGVDPAIVYEQGAVQNEASADHSHLAFTTKNCTNGNTIFVGVRVGGIMTAAITDDAGNTYVEDVYHYNSTDGDGLYIFHAYIASGGGTKITATCTLTGGSATIRWAIHEVSGLGIVVKDQTNHAEGTSATPDSGNITTTVNDEFLFGVLGGSWTGDATKGADWTLGKLVTAKYADEYRIVSSTLTESADFTITTSGEGWICAIASYYCYPLDYFGAQTKTTTDVNQLAYIEWNTTTFTCPGSGPQVVKELSTLCYGDKGTNVRLGLYDSTGTTLICQGVAEKNVCGDALSWQGHMTQAEITPNPAIITGGTTYIISRSNDACGDVLGFIYGYSLPGGNQSMYKSGDYTGGMPAPLPGGGTAATAFVCMRCGVTKAEAGLNVGVGVQDLLIV